MMLSTTALAFACLASLHLTTVIATPLPQLWDLTGADEARPDSGVKDSSDGASDSSLRTVKAKKDCSLGGTYVSFDDDFRSFAGDDWQVESGQSGLRYGSSGATLTLSQEMGPTGGIVIASRASWQAPMTMEVKLKSSSAGGIVGPFILKGPGSTADEIDLELVQGTFQTPLWHQGQRTEKGTDMRQKLGSKTKEIGPYKFTASDVKPAEDWHTYKLDWKEDSVTWSIDGEKRVQFTKTSSRWPEAALPIRWGLWATDPAADWAGTLDWQKNPHPVLRAKDLKVEGCRFG